MSRQRTEDASLEVVPDQSGGGIELDDRYNGLEAVREKPGNDYYGGLEEAREKPGNGLEVVGNPPAGYQQPIGSPQYTRMDAASNGTYVATASAQHQKPRRSRRTWYIWGAVILLLIIIIAVLGGVLGSRAHSGSTTTSNPPSPLSSPSTNTSSTSSTVSATNRLASIAWQNKNSNVITYRLYYQGNDLRIRESSWNSTTNGQLWVVSNHGIGMAKNQTPIAATTRYYTQGGLALHMFAVDASGQIVDWMTTDGTNWQNGSLASHSVRPANSSNLAASWSGNMDNSSLLLVYQDDAAHLQLCNLTSGEWTFSALPSNAIAGTGLAMNAVLEDQYVGQQRLFYQTGPGYLVAADWVSEAQIAALAGSYTPGWNLNEDSQLAKIEPLAPITSFPWGASSGTVSSYGAVSGLPYVVDVLASGSSGIAQTPWYPNTNGTYEIITKPLGMAAVQNYSSLASHAWGSVYAFEDGNIIEFTFTDPAQLDWSIKDNVVTV